MSASEIGINIKKIRESKNITRKDLAKRLMVEEDTVKKWEYGKRTPKDAYMLDQIASVLGVKIGVLFGEEGFMCKTKDIKDMIIDTMKIKNAQAKPPKVYVGIDEVVSAWTTYWEEYDQAVGLSLEYTGQEDEEFCENNSYLILFDVMSCTVYSVRDYGMYHPVASDFLFKTQLVPVYTHQPTETKRMLFEKIKKIREKLIREINSMYEQTSKPIVLIGHLFNDEGMNDYVGWSLADGKYMKVYDYKAYRSSFALSELADKSAKSTVTEKDEYGITPLSRELISEIGLDLFPDMWEFRMKRDCWEERELWKKRNCIAAENRELYDMAVEYINHGRSSRDGSDDCFVDLERRVLQLEKLSDLCAPVQIIQDQVKLIKSSLAECKTYFV